MSAENIEESVNIELMTRPDKQLEHEDRIFRKAVNFDVFSRAIHGVCQRCGQENDLTENKSVFCLKCGAMIYDRYHKSRDGKRIVRIVEHQ